jgi:hypothetical protein
MRAFAANNFMPSSLLRVHTDAALSPLSTIAANNFMPSSSYMRA